MIFLGQNNSKIPLLFFLSALVLVFIIFAWYKSDPFSNIQRNNDPVLADVSNKVEDAFFDVKNSIDDGLATVEAVQDEINREEQQAKLLNLAQQYAKNLASSTTSTLPLATTTSSDEN